MAFVAALEYATSKKSILISKPEQNFFNLAIEDMKLKNDEVLMIDDNIFADVSGAISSSIPAIQVRTGKFQKKDETNSNLQPDYRINSIADLSKFFIIFLGEVLRKKIISPWYTLRKVLADTLDMDQSKLSKE